MTKIVLTGRPGVGKTTIFLSAVNEAKRKGYVVGGIVCPEIREHGIRRGFKIVDLLTGEEELLAHKELIRSGLRIGRYLVNPTAGVFGFKAILRALKEADLIAIDEVGPMELRLHDLRSAIIKTLSQGRKPVFAVVHYRLSDPSILGLLGNAEKYVVTLENRGVLREKVIRRVLEILAGMRKT